MTTVKAYVQWEEHNVQMLDVRNTPNFLALKSEFLSIFVDLEQSWAGVAWVSPSGAETLMGKGDDPAQAVARGAVAFKALTNVRYVDSFCSDDADNGQVARVATSPGTSMDDIVLAICETFSDRQLVPAQIEAVTWAVRGQPDGAEFRRPLHEAIGDYERFLHDVVSLHADVRPGA